MTALRPALRHALFLVVSSVACLRAAAPQEPAPPPAPPVAVAPAPARATGPALTVEQALALRSVTNPRLGDDFVAFTLLVPRPLADGPGGPYQHLGVVDGLAALAPGARPEPRWLVAGKDSAPAMQVRPGQREVSFLRAVDGAMQVFVQPIEGGAARRWAVTPAVTAYRWRPDGGAVSFTALDPVPVARADAHARGFRQVVVDEDWRHLSLWVAEENGEPRQLTRGTTVFDHEWAPDSSKLACACAPRNLTDDSYMFQRLHVLDVASGALTKLVDNPGKLGAFAWSPDGSKLAYVTAADRNDPHAGQLAFVELASGQFRAYAGPAAAAMFTDVLWPGPGAHSGDGPMCIEHRGVRSYFGPRSASPDSEQVRPELPRGQLTAWSVTPRALAYTLGAPTHAPELFVEGIGRLTDSNPGLADVALGEQTIETFHARDGLEIEGVLIKPVGAGPGPHPLVIVAHGGPEAHFSDGWLTNYSNWGQLLAARGYVSWYPNYRSSTGYGVAFCKHDHGDPMGKEFQDHLDAIEHFAKAGLIDKARVGIGGGSYGGYTAAWAATRHSPRFAAAVSFVPFVDIRTKWLTSDIPWEFFYVHYQELWPWQQSGLLADRSPLTWAPQCQTPLLLLGGTADPRVHPSQPLMLYRAVKLGTSTPVRYVQYPGEGHGNRTNVYQLDYALRSLQWFDHYLLGDGERRTKELPPLDLDYAK